MMTEKLPTKAQAGWLRSAFETPGRVIGRPGRRTFEIMAAAGWVEGVDDPRDRDHSWMRLTNTGANILRLFQAKRLLAGMSGRHQVHKATDNGTRVTTLDLDSELLAKISRDNGSLSPSRVLEHLIGGTTVGTDRAAYRLAGVTRRDRIGTAIRAAELNRGKP